MSVQGNSGWRDFWKHDCRASCEPDNPAAAGEIAAAWEQRLAALPDGSRILDLATGNGIVLAHAAAAARASGRGFTLTGVDLAEIDPPRYVPDLDPELKSAAFLGGVAAEQLPFAARSFDAIVSQYGLEYAELAPALTEAARVLTPGGYLLWLAHSDGSEIVRQHRAQALEVDFLLAPRGPLYCMRRFAARQRRRKNPRYSFELLGESFAAADAFCRAHPPSGIVREVCGEFAAIANRNPAPDPGSLAERLDQAERRLRAHRDRIKSLLAAAITPERLAAVHRLLAEPEWLDLTIDELRIGVGKSLIGLWIRARRHGPRPAPAETPEQEEHGDTA